MGALAITIAFFLCATSIGIALLAALRRSAFGVTDVLVAPAAGFALVIVILVPLNRAGLPVQRFADVLAIALAAGTIATLAWLRSIILVPLRACGLFALILFGALLLTANPMFSLGSNWFAYANTDAVNYALSAERLRIHGLYDVPDQAAYVADRDVRDSFYLLNAGAPDRYGVDELLAFESAMTRSEAFRVIMPSLVSLYLASIAALAALVYRGKHARGNALVASIALAVSAMGTTGVESQLLGQIAGMMFVSAFLALACAADVRMGTKIKSLNWIGIPLLFSALCESYPELVPFAIATAVGFYVVRRPVRLAEAVPFFASIAIASAILLNDYGKNVAFVIAARLRSPIENNFNDIFPYLMLPSGIPNLFGLTALGNFPSEPLMSISIACGIVLLFVAAAAAVRAVLRREPSGILLLCYFAVAIGLFAHNSGFALFKIALYMQTSLIAVLATGFVAFVASPSATRWRFPAVAVGVCILTANVITQQFYVTVSRGSADQKSSSYVEVWDVSGGRLFDRLSELRKRLAKSKTIISDTSNRVVAKIESYYGRGSTSVSFPAENEQDIASLLPPPNLPFYNTFRRATARRLAVNRNGRFIPEAFRTHAVDAYFLIDGNNDASNAVFWLHGSDGSLFNRSRIRYDGLVENEAHAQNVLAFVGSSAGNPLIGHEPPIALYPLEPDNFFPGSTMSAVGRYLLFEVLQPHAPFRIRLAMSETFRNGGYDSVPPAAIIGTSRVQFAVTGRGSADVISGIVTPRVIRGHSFIMLDMGTLPIPFATRRSGLMNLWGRDVLIDPRRPTGFVRDVSVVDESDRVEAPDSLSKFPDDLRPPNVVYSGIYEDGWASDDFAVTLRVKADGLLHLDGLIPLIGDPDFRTNVTCLVDGFAAGSWSLPVGSVHLSALAGSGVHRIEWRFSQYQRLPRGDDRRVSMLVQSIGS